MLQSLNQMETPSPDHERLTRRCHTVEHHPSTRDLLPCYSDRFESFFSRFKPGDRRLLLMKDWLFSSLTHFSRAFQKSGAPFRSDAWPTHSTSSTESGASDSWSKPARKFPREFHHVRNRGIGHFKIFPNVLFKLIITNPFPANLRITKMYSLA